MIYTCSFSVVLFFIPDTRVDKSPNGRLNGNSTESRIRAKNMYHPNSETTNKSAAPACWKTIAGPVWPCDTAKKEADRQATITNT
jgi:hypothetical protein